MPERRGPAGQVIRATTQADREATSRARGGTIGTPTGGQTPLLEEGDYYSKLLQFLGNPLENAETGPAKAIALLSKGQRVGNLEKILKSLVGTGYEDLSKFMARRYPRIMGNATKKAEVYVMPGGQGGFQVADAHDPVRKLGVPAGNVQLDPHEGWLGKLFGGAEGARAETMGHEILGHGTQALRKTPQRFEDEYVASSRTLAHKDRPLEIDAYAKGAGFKQQYLDWVKEGKPDYYRNKKGAIVPFRKAGKKLFKLGAQQTGPSPEHQEVFEYIPLAQGEGMPTGLTPGPDEDAAAEAFLERLRSTLGR